MLKQVEIFAQIDANVLTYCSNNINLYKFIWTDLYISKS